MALPASSLKTLGKHDEGVTIREHKAGVHGKHQDEGILVYLGPSMTNDGCLCRPEPMIRLNIHLLLAYLPAQSLYCQRSKEGF